MASKQASERVTWNSAMQRSMGVLLAGASCLAFAGAAYAATEDAPLAKADTASVEGAQDAAPAAAPQADTEVLEALVVTARRREESIIKTPVAVSVASGETLRERSVTRQQDLVLVTPGLTAQAGSQASRSTAVFAIRGQGGGAGVSTYFAEVPDMSSAFFDLENIQVLKGPQGTLFGRVTTGGAVLVTPKGPGDEFNGYVNVKLGKFDRREVEFAVGGPLIEDKLAVRLSGQILRNNGFTKNSFSGLHMDGQDSQNYRAIVDFNPTSKLHNRTIGVLEYVKDPARATVVANVIQQGSLSTVPGLGTIGTGNMQTVAPSVAVALGVACPGNICPNYLTLEQGALAAQRARSRYVIGEDNANYPRTDTRRMGIVNTTSYDVTDAVSLKNIFSYQATEGLGPTNENYDGMYVPALGRITAPSEHGPRSLTEEVQLQANLFDERLQFTGGGYYEHFWTPSYQASNVIQYGGYLGSCTSAVLCASSFSASRVPFGVRQDTINGVTYAYTGAISTLTKAKNDDYAVYGQATFNVTDKLALTAGGRYTWSKRWQDSSGNFSSVDLATGKVGGPSQALFMGALPFLVPIGTSKLIGTFPGHQTLQQKFEKFTYSLSANYTFSDDFMAYATTRRGYKPGAFNNQAPYTYGPETVTDYELGAKYQGRLGPIRTFFSADVFYDKYTDIQRSTTLAGPPAYLSVQNVAAARIQGLDLDASFAYEALKVATFFNITDAKYTDYPNTGQFVSQGIPATADLTQTRLQFTSKYQAGIRPSLDIARLVDGAPDLVLSGNLYYQSSFASSEPNLGPSGRSIIPAITRLDLRLDWKEVAHTAVNVAFVVNNVLDYDGRVSGNALSPSSGFDADVYSEPRRWYVELNYKF